MNKLEMMIGRAAVLTLIACQTVKAAVPGPEAEPGSPLDACNVVWDSPSTNSLGSMPLGNGDIGVNAWVEPNGDVVFYVSKVDAFDADHTLRKLGRVRLHLTPALTNSNFRQTLVLRDGAMTISVGDVHLRLWVDANHPVIRVTGTSRMPMDVMASFETLRDCSELDDKADRLAWGYRNTSSVWMDRVRSQNTPEFAAEVVDPIMNRTSGCRLSGNSFVRVGKRALKLCGSNTLDLSVRVLSSQTATLPEWFEALEKPVACDEVAHRRWWRGFWARSHIFVEKCGEGKINLDQCRFTQYAQGSKAYAGHTAIDAAQSAFQLSQRYALERFVEACAGRGCVPQPFNGSIFTMDLPVGVPSLVGREAKSADHRDWAGLPFMWQNTRHPYWAMATRGDYDTLRPGMQFVRNGLHICRDHCRKILGHDGAFIMEASLWHNVGVFNGDGLPGHLRYHFLATIEMPAIMCDYYEHTGDRSFLDEILLPCADEFIKFYELQFPQRDARGKLLMEPAATVETYLPVTNPNTEITGLRYVLTKLLIYDIGAERKAHWRRLLAAMPDVPTRRIKGLDLLAVGEKYAPGREICETPEMYSVYPFRQAWLGNEARLAMGRQSYHVRTISLDGTDDKQAVETGGWQSAPVQAAYLGLPREAARLTSINFNDQFVDWTDNVDPHMAWPSQPRARFPAFWETKMDYTPDSDHGAVSANALQSMLLQSDGGRIFLLPAWPEDWDVSFKLHAAGNTTVECVYRDGAVRSLVVTPELRKAQLVDMSSLEQRVRTMVSVACADRNYLFGLPPMLDGLPTPGKTTGPWLAKYAESLTGVRAGPWPGCVFRNNIVYVHALDGAPQMPSLPCKLISKTFLTGKNEKPDTILKLEYDRPVEEFALAAPSQGSLTAGRKLANGEMDLGVRAAFDRVEFTIDNPGHRRGQGRVFELQIQETDGAWRTICRGAVYGNIFSKQIDAVTAQRVRLKIQAAIRNLDLFPPKRTN